MHNKLLHSISNEIRKVVKEQFNIANIDLNNKNNQNNNIFNKQVLDIDDVYNKICNNIQLQSYVISELDSIVSVYKLYNEIDLAVIVRYYHKYFNEHSLNWLDVSGIDDMSYMFNEADYNGDISKWDVSNVITMERMFTNSSFNGDISEWDVSKVKDMSYMFNKSSFNGDISMWNVSNVTSMRCMFASSSFNHDISQWDVSNVLDMFAMFYNAPFNQRISGWDVSNVKDMSSMFAASLFNQDISDWNVSKITTWCTNMFDNCPIKEQYKPIKIR